MATTQERIKSLFADLGKPTLRGVKKCPKCGTLNGTRGLSCKNKECNTVFRDKVRKAGHSADAVRIITGSTVQVFSVRLRDRGPDYRGFVQLPLTTDADGNPTQTVDGAALIAASGAGRCFVETCQRVRHVNVGAAPEKTLELIELADGSPKISKKRKKDDTLAQASSALLTLQDSGNIPSKKTPIKKTAASPPSAKRLAATIDETEISLSFQEWLGSVVERINQTMHYQFDGYPDPLVFHVPQPFFDALQQRISAGCKKRRLPNSTVAFVRKDALPLGTFSKYTWHITNILHVKQIFDTPLMPLEVTRSFVENRDGTYEPYDAPKVEVETIAEAYRKIEGQQAIKPFELKTYLKVGNTSPDQKEPTPFVIEWIPDILPKCKIGELRIKFEYGHQRNGHMEVRRPVAIPEVVEPML
ncbi:C2orf42 [Branchiostoma lanceolatum]|uniref:C2orf42 protein n=1 Tax=Branchiostoma lanceolatum TaxID=7740 RepID=A0A8J9ZMB5_BRALA|nr:C2orf42 [Branchiostoma lanceolatum]